MVSIYRLRFYIHFKIIDHLYISGEGLLYLNLNTYRKTHSLASAGRFWSSFWLHRHWYQSHCRWSHCPLYHCPSRSADQCCSSHCKCNQQIQYEAQLHHISLIIDDFFFSAYTARDFVAHLTSFCIDATSNLYVLCLWLCARVCVKYCFF